MMWKLLCNGKQHYTAVCIGIVVLHKKTHSTPLEHDLISNTKFNINLKYCSKKHFYILLHIPPVV